jgi:hypothetical protein
MGQSEPGSLEQAENGRKSAGPLLPGKKKIMKNTQPRSRPPQRVPGRRSTVGGRLVGDKGQLEVINDPVNHGIIGEEGDDLHRAAALGADQGVDFIDLRDDEKFKNCAQSVPKNIENYRKISKFIEIWEALKKGFLQGKALISCALAFSVAAYTR